MRGFVYILGNWCMPGIYKIGHTTADPQMRATEISRGTGVPVDFDVLCFVEVNDSAGTEKRIHRALDRCRVSAKREFFKLPFPIAVGALYHLPQLKRFVDVAAAPEIYYEWNLAGSYDELPNPWASPEIVPSHLSSLVAKSAL